MEREISLVPCCKHGTVDVIVFTGIYRILGRRYAHDKWESAQHMLYCLKARAKFCNELSCDE